MKTNAPALLAQLGAAHDSLRPALMVIASVLALLVGAMSTFLAVQSDPALIAGLF